MTPEEDRMIARIEQQAYGKGLAEGKAEIRAEYVRNIGQGRVTPDERAKKITIFVEKHMSVGPSNWYSQCEPLIAAEIRAAVEEAKKSVDVEHEWNMGYAAGRYQAYEDAAKIVSEGWLCNGCADQGRDLADLIRARAAEVGK